MSTAALILTYHAVEAGPPPLCIEPSLFRSHLDCLQAGGARTLTLSELAAAVRARRVPPRSVAITFDDGFESIAKTAAPMLAERGQSATVFCVAGHLGAENDWPTQPPAAPRRRLADPPMLAELAEAGHEIGSHGMEHFPLGQASEERAAVELVDSKRELERAIGVPVRSFALPYGERPTTAGRAQLRATYSAACAGGMRRVTAEADVFELPRVDAHYLRRPLLLRSALDGRLDPYLLVRDLGARARRIARRDYRLRQEL
jgi:peptidoglycan/xylan/chitin deacetylase (PgdA/CDA1 family)